MLTDLYMKIRIFPNSVCTHQKKTVHCFGGEILVKCFQVTTIYSLQSHGCEVL